MNSPVTTRTYRASDADTVIEIMNHAIAEGRNAYLEPFDQTSGLKWLDELTSSADPLLVAIEGEGVVVGWGSLTPYRKGRGAFSKVREITFYVHRDFRRRGVGRLFINELENRARMSKVQHSIAVLLDDNEGRISLLESHEYKVCGHMPMIAQLNDKTKGQLFMTKTL